jgi:hypothetical protein
VQVGKGEHISTSTILSDDSSQANTMDGAGAASIKDTLPSTGVGISGRSDTATGAGGQNQASAQGQVFAPYRGPPAGLPDHPGCAGDFPGTHHKESITLWRKCIS